MNDESGAIVVAILATVVLMIASGVSWYVLLDTACKTGYIC